jgi:hypothetical protein
MFRRLNHVSRSQPPRCERSMGRFFDQGETMKKILMFLLLALCAGSLGAAPVIFDSSQFQTDALALAGAVSDSHSDVSPPAPLPLLTTAVATSGADSADSSGSADVGFLGAFAEVGSESQSTSALGSAEFSGNFTLSGTLLRLLVNFDSLNTLDGGTAGGQILLFLAVDGTTLINQLVDTSGVFERFFVVPVGGLGVLDLLLTSNADATAGAAFNLSAAIFSLELSEAPTLLVFASGLLGLLLMLRIGRARLVRV